MARLQFDITQVIRLVDHALAAPEHSIGFGHTGEPRPQLMLVKDHGIYLMSNGIPADMDENHPGPSEKRFVVYAKGYDPRQGDVGEKCRDAVGGDDFVEYLDLTDAMVAELRTAVTVRIDITADRVSLYSGHRKADAPKYDPAVAQEIYRQLGGRRFKAMTGARGLLGYNDALHFSLPAKAGFVKQRINRVAIRLTAMDEYEITFSRYMRNKGHPVTKEIAKVEGVQCTELATIFTAYTGLRTTLGG